MDHSALVAKRLGAPFRDLFVNDGGLFVYFRDQLGQCVQAVHCEADGRGMLSCTRVSSRPNRPPHRPAAGE